MMKNWKFEIFIKSLKNDFSNIPEQEFLFSSILNGAKHSPLFLGVWVTEGRILELQRKFGGLSFVMTCLQKLSIFIEIRLQKLELQGMSFGLIG